MGRAVCIAAAAGLAVSLVSAHAQVNVPLRKFALASAGGMKAELRGAAGPAAVRVAFAKSGEERRLLAIEARPQGDLSGARAVAVQYGVQLTRGDAPRLAVVVFDEDGGSWYTVGAHPLETGPVAEARLSVAALKETAFSEDQTGQLEWNRVARMWIGLVLDGATEGSFEVIEAHFTDEPYRPDRPLSITGDGPGEWSVGKDAAVQATLTTPNESPAGKPCMKFEFRFPGGRHMWATPSVPMPPADLEGYRALRFTYKAALPAGINGLLVMLGEQNGSQYFADPAPPAQGQWTTVTIPLDRFELGTWSKDDNGQLNLEQVARVFVGVHGTATGEGGPGVILVTDLQLVP